MILFLFCSLGAAGQEIPRWKLADLEKTISNSNQPLILNFWGTFLQTLPGRTTVFPGVVSTI
jgi:hypothetical protein